MTDSQAVVQEPEFEEGKSGLVFFGILQVLLGAVLALIALMTVLAVFKDFDKAAAEGYTAGMVAASFLMFAVAAAYLIWMGVGSMLARRWARALIVVVSCLWLIFGISGLLSMVLTHPLMLEQMARDGKITAGQASFAVNFGIGLTAFMGVVVPAVLVLFYGKNSTRSQFEQLDPVKHWTDRCPLPVLALSLLFLLVAASSLLSAVLRFPMPVFGFVVKGVPAALISLGVAILSGWLARGVYRTDILAWRAGLIAVALGALSALLTYRLSGRELIEGMPFPTQQLEMMRQTSESVVPYFQLAVWIGIFIGLLLYTKKFFVPDSGDRLNGRTL